MAEHSKVLVGLTLGSVACVPRVPATLVVDDSRAPEQRDREPKRERSEARPGSDRTPPTVVRAELANSTRLRIEFSEPIVVAGGFDPADFRISYLRVDFDKYSASYYAFYYDPAYFHSGSYDDQLRLTSARVLATGIEIDFVPEFSPVLCRQHEYAQYDPPGIETDDGFFLHYAAGRIPITDTAGNPLANFGTQWVALGRQHPAQARVVIEGRPAVKAGAELVEIACGPPIPPGPR